MRTSRQNVAVPNLTVQQLEYLVALADAPTAAVAAAAVGVTPSALSQGLAELERRVGLPLFERDGRRRVLSAAAAPVLAHAREVLARTIDLARYTHQLREGHGGSLRVGMIDAAVERFSVTLRHFRAHRRDLDLRLTVTGSAALLELLRRAELDLVVCVEPPGLVESLVTTPLTSEPLFVHAPDRRALDRPPREWGPWVTFPTGAHTRLVIQQALRRVGAGFDVVAESHQPAVLREMVRVGLGWTVLPPAAGRRSDTGHAMGQPIADRRLVVARRAEAAPNPAGEALEQVLHQAVAGERT
ncbi:MAG TPA: LysR family transcriptional regulator [Acidimicrobiales bacterium]|nr:LysR family transcriptional regulator [Acidimicrobiales bacterium]